jgi:hypothetical protein
MAGRWDWRLVGEIAVGIVAAGLLAGLVAGLVRRA